jgi:hypothetical protein
MDLKLKVLKLRKKFEDEIKQSLKLLIEKTLKIISE